MFTKQVAAASDITEIKCATQKIVTTYSVTPLVCTC